MSLSKLIKEAEQSGSWLIDLLNEKGYKIDKLGDDRFLGQGQYSKVYKVNDSRILKLSFRQDRQQEIDEYKKLIGKQLKNVARVFYAKYRERTGIVIMEKLWLSDYNYIFDERVIDHEGIDDLTYKFMQYHIDHSNVKNANLLFDYICEDYRVEPTNLINDGMANEADEYLSDLLNGLFELDKNNVHYNDIHSSNIMMDRLGTYKIIDFYH